MGILLEFLFGINLGPALLISTIFSIIYIWNGGFTAVVRTDLLQFILMFLAFFLLVGFSWHSIGDPISHLKSLPEKFLDPLGGNTYQYILVWFFIAAWTFIDPGFFQRCAAADSPKTAKKGILIAIGFWAIFDSLTILCGLYTIGYIQNDQALMVYPMLALDILPYGFFLPSSDSLTAFSPAAPASRVLSLAAGSDAFWSIILGIDLRPDSAPFG